MLNINTLKQYGDIRRFFAGQVIVEENPKNPGDIYVMLMGKANVLRNFGQTTQEQLAVQYSGVVAGSTGMFYALAGGPAVVAAADCVVACFTKEQFCSFLAASPQAAYETMQTFYIHTLPPQAIVAPAPVAAAAAPNAPAPTAAPNAPAPAAAPSAPAPTAAPSAQTTPISAVAALTGAAASLYPSGHGQYDIPHPPEHDQFLYGQTYTCPCCKLSFTGYMVITSRLKAKGSMGCDLRREFQDFEPLWYDVHTCPHCFFSGLESFWNQRVSISTALSQQLAEIRSSLSIDFAAPADIQQVFASYYIALHCATAWQNDKQIIAKLWRQLSWIYQDLEDKPMEQYATEKAYDATEDYFSHCNLQPEAEQMVCMVMGTLARRLGKLDAAVRHLSTARRFPETKRVYKQLIEVEMDIIRDMRDSLKG